MMTQPLHISGRLVWTSLEYLLPATVFVQLTRAYSHLSHFLPCLSIHSSFSFATIPPYHSLTGIWTEAEMKELAKMVKGIGSFPSLTSDQTSLVEHVGEGVPLNADGSCPHPYLIPNIKRTLCILATRIDVGVHYVKSGGPSGLKERFDSLALRTLSFSKFFISNPLSAEKQAKTTASELDLPELKTLFESSAYRSSALSVCHGLSVLDPFQLGVIIQLPGQQLGVHRDAPWFFGANRFHYPQWLLLVMRGSGLWEHRAVRQVQGVAYLHEWSFLSEETEEEYQRRNGGEFQYWPTPNTTVPQLHVPVKNSAIILDGSLIPHGTALFRPGQASSLPVHLMNRNGTTTLEYVKGEDRWALQVDGRRVKSYALEDVRISLVWRAMCFASKSERARYHSYDQTINPDITMEEILGTLKDDLRTRGYTTPEDALELAILMLEVYVDMPWPSQAVPFNYCIVPGAIGEAIRRIAC